jgi:hypothetical protein
MLDCAPLQPPFEERRPMLEKSAFDLHRILRPENRVATGNDSHVFRYGEHAFKEYFAVSVEGAADYVRTMNQCVTLIERLAYRFRLNISGEEYSVCFRGVPVNGLMQSAAGRAVTVSTYIPEPNLDWLTAAAERFRSYSYADLDPERQHFFARLNATFSAEHPTRLRDEFEFHLCMLSRMLDFHLNSFGLYIGKYNVKLLPALAIRSITLMVTDVAVYLPRVIRCTNYEAAVNAAGALSAAA